MSVTRHALRVYTALSELRQSRGDILDALIPFFEPILEVMDGKFFDPRLFALGVRRLLRWRFTKDIAEQFIPRLERHGYLQRSGTVRAGAYTVRYKPPDETAENLPIADILSKILDEFERFVPIVTELKNYTRTRDELTDFLVRFLVSMDAYGQLDLLQEIERLELDQEAQSVGREAQSVIANLEEGGAPLSNDDRYMCARFVRHICAAEPKYVEHLARLASIGLLTEVVEDFIKPIQTAEHVGLTVVLDAPIALDLLGCSGKALQDDVKNVVDSLSAIGCTFVVFPVTCIEMQANLKSMLSKPGNERYGYTFDAMVRREVMEEFVLAVAHDPERALARIGVKVKPITLQQFPNAHVHFDEERYEGFFAGIRWVQEVAPREHDATCMALLMRLREGKHHSDVFRCGYVFVTRNPTFVRESRRYCLESRLINELQEGPVIHQRELATIAWLRTGLGASEQIPRGHLLATCDRVLRVRNEVREAVATKLRQVTPEKLEQYELLLYDQRSLRKLADETLNDETVVTAENAERLLELMRLATVEQERQQFEGKLREEQERNEAMFSANRTEAEKLASERDAALLQLLLKGAQRMFST